MISRSHVVILILLILGIFMYQSKIKPEAKEDHIAVIHIHGSFTPYNSIQWEYHLTKAIEDDTARSIIIQVNSGGGRSAENLKDLIGYANTVKPTVVYIDQGAASAAYEAITNAETIYANETSIAGSIGSFHYKHCFKELYDYLGVKYKIISTNDELEQWVNNTDKSKKKQMLTSHVNKTFKQLIIDSRNIDPKYLNGDTWVGYKAKEINFIDEIVNSIDDVKKIMINKHQLNKKIKYKHYNINDQIYGYQLSDNITDIIKALIYRSII